MFFSRTNIFRTGFGVGDVLLASVILKALSRIYMKKYVVETRFPELFYNNPHVSFVLPAERRAVLIRKTFEHRFMWRIGSIINEWFEKRLIRPTYPFPCKNKHLVDAMAESVGIELLPHERRPFIYLTKEEIKFQSWAKNWIAVQSSSSTYWTNNKHWIPGRMQEVINALSAEGYFIVHIGSKDDEALTKVKDLRGKTTLRETAALLSNAALFIGMEGGIVHLARAVNTRSVVIYTHYTLPEETGYVENVNLRRTDNYYPCWNRKKCDECRVSAENITTEMVIDEVLKILEKNPIMNT